MILTIRDAEQALKRVELVNPPFQIDRFIWGGSLHVVTHVQDRRSGNDSMIRFHFVIPLPLSEEQFFEFVASRVRATILHEFEEMFHVDGVRVYDPHPNGLGVLLNGYDGTSPFREPALSERPTEHDQPERDSDRHRHPLDVVWDRHVNSKSVDR